MFGRNPPQLKANRKFTAILVCLFVSLTFWFLIALSKEYTTRWQLPVEYQHFPGKKVVMNELPASFALTLKTSGFSILSYDFGHDQQPLVIDVSTLLTNAGKEDLSETVTVATSDLASEISGQLGSNLSILSVSPDSLVFNFGSRTSRTVPVRVDATLTCERQFDSLGTYSVMPHEVEVSGPESVLSEIRYVETEPVVVAQAKSDIRMKLKLRIPQHVECSTSEVQFFIPVEKFTEGSVEIPLRSVNVRGNLALRTFPDKVRVRYLVPLSKYAMVKPGQFEALVNADDIRENGPTRLPVSVSSSPGFVRAVTVEPERVEFILRKK